VEKPLLHTWSLAVEEQFYLALPKMLSALLRVFRGHRIALPAALGVLALVCTLRLADEYGPLRQRCGNARSPSIAAFRSGGITPISPREGAVYVMDRLVPLLGLGK
jgi:peptidoglycan/LPS O-acetylase OafA/YrhL